jgi:hypothetical protein
MSKLKLEMTVRRELQKLNGVIDEKIIKGIPYAKEAKRHKFLLARLSDLRDSERFNWFSKAVSIMTSFTL